MARCATALALLMGAGGLVGCSSPTLSVVSAELIESSDSGSVVAFTLDAKNAGEDALPTRYIAYSAQAGGLAFNAGERSGEATLRAAGEQQIVIPASFPGRVSVGEMASINGTLGYTQPGPLASEAFDLGIYRPSVSFSGSATIEEPRPRAKPIRTTPVLSKPKDEAKAGEAAPK